MSGTRISNGDRRDRGQAYTLEGFAAAAVVLFALLFAMQSVVITPGTGGAVDRTAQAQIQQETQDALVVAAHADSGEGNLSELVRYWAADGEIDSASPTEDFEERFVLGEILGTHVSEAAYPDDYRVEFVYLNESGNVTEPRHVAGTNISDSTAVTASYTVPVFEHQNGTEYRSGKIEETDTAIPDGPIPDRSGTDDPIHNVVEVRVIVW